jgi:hypothetical protein
MIEAHDVERLLARASQPHVAFLGRIPGTSSYSDLARHPENEELHGAVLSCASSAHVDGCVICCELRASPRRSAESRGL